MVKRFVTLSLVGVLFCALAGCGATQGKVTSLQRQNDQLAETLRQDRVRLSNLEEQNRQLQLKLADAEKAVAVLHDTTSDPVKRR